MKIKRTVSVMASLAVATSAFAAVSLTSKADNDVLYNYDFTTGGTVYSNDFTTGTVVEAYTFDSDPGESWSLDSEATVSDGVLAIKGTNANATTYKLPDINDGGVYDIIWNKTSTGSWFQVDLAKADGTKISGQWMIIQNAAGNNYNHSNAVSDISPHRVRIDTSTGAWSAYTGSYETASGTSNPAEGYMLKFKSWDGSGTVHSLQDLTVSKVTAADLTGWYIPSSSKTETAADRLVIGNSGSWNSSAEVDTVFSLSDLDADSTYEITWEGMSGGDWAAFELVNKGTYANKIYQTKTAFYNPAVSITENTMIPIRIVLNTGTGSYTAYTGSSTIGSGSVGVNGDYQLNFHTTGDNFTYTIDNFKVEKVLAADTTNWALTNASAESNRLAIGSNGVAELALSALDADSIYDIEWDWIGNSGDNWLDFGVYSGTESWQIAEKFDSTTQTAALYYNGVHGVPTGSTSNKITLNTKTGEWTVYVNGDEKISGSTAATSGYSFKLHSWADVTHYIDNVTVTKTGTVDEPDAEPITADTPEITEDNGDGTYKVGLKFAEAFNPSDYEYIVFRATVDGNNQYKGDTVQHLLGSYDGPVSLAILLTEAPSADVAVQFTNASITLQ